MTIHTDALDVTDPLLRELAGAIGPENAGGGTAGGGDEIPPPTPPSGGGVGGGVTIGGSTTPSDEVASTLANTPYAIGNAALGLSDTVLLLGDSIYIESVTGGTLTLDNVVVPDGTALDIGVIRSGELVWTPPAGEIGDDLGEIHYHLVSSRGVADASHTLYFNVLEFNTAPVSTATQPLAATEDTPYVFSVSDFGFSDPVDGNALKNVIITDLPETGTLWLGNSLVLKGEAISATDIADGKLVWELTANQNGSSLGSFKFELQDDGGTYGGSDTSSVYALSFDVASVPDVPSAGDGEVTIFEDTTYTITASLLGIRDGDGTDDLASITVAPDNRLGVLKLGDTAVTDITTISYQDLADGKLTWTPNENYDGQDIPFTFIVTDKEGNQSTVHSVTIDIAAVDDPPVPVGAFDEISEDKSYTLKTSDFAYMDVEGDTVTTVIISDVAHGTLMLGDKAIAAGDTVAWSDIADGKLVWTPDADLNGKGSASISFQLVDNGDTSGAGSNTSDVAKIVFNIDAVNDAPVAAGLDLSTEQNTPVALDSSAFAFSDVDGNDLQSVVIGQIAANGTLTLGGTTVTAGEEIDAKKLKLLTWTPNAGVSGSGIVGFTYQLRDDGGTANGGTDLSDTVTAIFDVSDHNHAPVLGFGPVSTPENRPLTLDVLAAASDADGDALTITSAALVKGFGTVTIEHGKLFYDPTAAPNQNLDEGESRVVTVRYAVSDGNGGTASQKISITVDGVSPDVWTGTAGADTLTGGKHVDVLDGLGGNDLLDGGKGADSMVGGLGNDTYIVDNKGDVVTEAAQGGTDLVESSVDYALTANVENLTLTGSGDIDATGNALANVLTGNKGKNTLDGAAGADTLTGGLGRDVFLFSNLADSTAKAKGRDTITDFDHRDNDRIDLSPIDANAHKAGDQALHFIGTSAFDGHAGELRFVEKHGATLVSIDVDGDRKADFSVAIDEALHLKAGDFLL